MHALLVFHLTPWYNRDGKRVLLEVHLDQASLAPGRDQGIEVEAPWGGLAISLEPTWAAVCGYLASGPGHWGGINALRAIAAWLLADAILGCIFAQLIAIGRLSPLQDGPDREGVAVSFGVGIPYAAVGAPGYRLMRLVTGRVRRWRERIWPRAQPHALTAIVGAGLALVMAAYLGPKTLALAAGGILSAACLAVLARRNEAFLVRCLAGLHPALAWSLGHTSVAPWRASLLGVSALFGLGAYARTRLTVGRCAGAVWLLGAIWVVLVMVLLVVGQPILAAMAAIAALVDNMSAGSRHENGNALGSSRPGRWGWLFATLLTSLVIAYRS